MLTTTMVNIGKNRITFHLDRSKIPADVAIAQKGDEVEVFVQSCPKDWQSLDDADLSVKVAQFVGLTNVGTIRLRKDVSLHLTEDYEVIFSTGDAGLKFDLNLDKAIMPMLFSDYSPTSRKRKITMRGKKDA